MTFTPASKALARFKVLDLTRVRAGPTAARQLAGKRWQGRAKRLFLLDLCGQVVFLLRHCLEEEHHPGFPVLFLLADGLLRPAQRKIIAVLVALDNALHRAV